MTGRAGHKNPRVSDSELAGEPAVGHSPVDSDDFTANVVDGYRRGDRVDIAGSERQLATGEPLDFLLTPPFALADQRLTAFASWRGGSQLTSSAEPGRHGAFGPGSRDQLTQPTDSSFPSIQAALSLIDVGHD